MALHLSALEMKIEKKLADLVWEIGLENLQILGQMAQETILLVIVKDLLATIHVAIGHLVLLLVEKKDRLEIETENHQAHLLVEKENHSLMALQEDLATATDLLIQNLVGKKPHST